MRLIDADELKECLKDLKAEGNNQKYVQGLQDAIDNYFPQIIDDAPTADVQSVKHGKWVYRCTIGWMKHYDCTSCYECIAGETEISWWKFCPKCGARMDLKDGDE